MSKTLPKSVVLVGHGSRRETANNQFKDLVKTFAKKFAPLKFSYGFIELAKPHIAEVLHLSAAESQEIVIVPAMLFNAGHVKNDLAILVDQIKSSHPGTKITLSSALGQSHHIVNFYHDCLKGFQLKPEQDLLLAVGRGASDIDANGEFVSQIRKIAESSGFIWSIPSFIGITSPLFDETLAKAIGLRMKRIFILPYFLYPGLLVERIFKKIEDVKIQFPWIKFEVLPILGTSEALKASLKDKVTDSRLPSLACGTCQYRVPLGKFHNKVGGLDTLLWSLRHMETHKQGSSAEHSHKPIKKHVLVCTNHDCANRGSIELLHQLRRQLRGRKKLKDYKITRTSCMGKCGEGPTIAVYPDGIWYRNFSVEDIPPLIEGHLFNEILVQHRIDLIM